MAVPPKQAQPAEIKAVSLRIILARPRNPPKFASPSVFASVLSARVNETH